MKLLESKYGLYHHASKSFQSYFKDMFSLQTKSYQCNGKFYNRICLWSGNVPFCPECYWRLGHQYKQGNFFDLPCLQWDVHWSYERLTIRQHFILVNWYFFVWGIAWLLIYSLLLNKTLVEIRFIDKNNSIWRFVRWINNTLIVKWW